MTPVGLILAIGVAALAALFVCCYVVALGFLLRLLWELITEGERWFALLIVTLIAVLLACGILVSAMVGLILMALTQ